MQILDGYGAEPQEAERDRVQLAILRLSEGQQAKLQHYVQAAKRDYRDVLYWSEHPAPLPGASILEVLRTNWSWAYLEPVIRPQAGHFCGRSGNLRGRQVLGTYPPYALVERRSHGS